MSNISDTHIQKNLTDVTLSEKYKHRINKNYKRLENIGTKIPKLINSIL